MRYFFLYVQIIFICKNHLLHVNGLLTVVAKQQQQISQQSKRINMPPVPDLLNRSPGYMGSSQHGGGGHFSGLGVDDNFPPPPSPLTLARSPHRGRNELAQYVHWETVGLNDDMLEIVTRAHSCLCCFISFDSPVFSRSNLSISVVTFSSPKSC